MVPQMRVKHSKKIDLALDRDGYSVMTGCCRYVTPFRHWHHGIEIVFVQAGTAQLFYGTWTRELVPGEVVLAPTRMQHGAKGYFRRTAVHFVPDILSRERRRLVEEVLEAGEGRHLILLPEAVSRFTWAVTELHRIATQGHPGTQLTTVRAILGLVLADMEASLHRPPDCSGTRLVKEIAAYMRANVGAYETLDSIAARFGCSSSQLWDLFRTHLGTSPGTYWRKVRLEHARQLLTDGIALENVCEAVGFGSLRGLRRAFRQEFGLSPSEYKRLMARPKDAGK